MSIIIGVTIIFLLLTFNSRSGNPGTWASVANSDCQQSVNERSRLMAQAENETFTVRRVEFIGLTYTHDQVVRDRMTPLVQEGDIFSRKKLGDSLQRMSELRSIYPLRFRNVALRLDAADKAVDMLICFKQKPRSKVSTSRAGASQQALGADSP